MLSEAYMHAIFITHGSLLYKLMDVAIYAVMKYSFLHYGVALPHYRESKQALQTLFQTLHTALVSYKWFLISEISEILCASYLAL